MSIMVTGIKNLPADLIKVVVYPNPFSEGFNVVLGSSITFPVTITLIDQKGIPIYSRSLTNGEANSAIPIHTKNLEPGIYFMGIESQFNSVFTKVIKE
jgi:hypothetical protein